MVNSEDDMTNLKETETKFTVGDRRTLNGTKRADWHGWKKCNRKINHVTLTNTTIISGLQSNLFSVTQALQKGF